MKVALLMGNRLNPWHTRLYEPLLEMGVDLCAFTYRPLRYPLEDVQIPYEIIPTEAEERSLPQRAIEGIETRLLGTDISERPVGLADRLKGFDLIHSWELFTMDTEEALTAREKWGIPVLVTVWDNIPYHRDEDQLVRQRKKRALDQADAFLVYTEESRAMLETEGADPGKVQKVYPAVDMTEFSPSTPISPPVILGIGRMVPEKGFEDLLSAASLLRKHSPDLEFRVHLVGDGPLAERVDQMAVWGGHRDRYERTPSLCYKQLPNLYRGATLLALPSRPTSEWKEQFGMVLIEAMASGVPVVASVTGGIPEMIGNAGVLIPPGDFSKLAESIEDLLTSPQRWESLQRTALERCRTHFQLENNAQQIRNLYGSLADSTSETSNPPSDPCAGMNQG